MLQRIRQYPISLIKVAIVLAIGAGIFVNVNRLSPIGFVGGLILAMLVLSIPEGKPSENYQLLIERKDKTLTYDKKFATEKAAHSEVKALLDLPGTDSVSIVHYTEKGVEVVSRTIRPEPEKKSNYSPKPVAQPIAPKPEPEPVVVPAPVQAPAPAPVVVTPEPTPVKVQVKKRNVLRVQAVLA